LDAVFEYVPPELRSTSLPDEAERLISDPVAAHRICELTVRRLIALPAATPSMRLIADKTAIRMCDCQNCDWSGTVSQLGRQIEQSCWWQRISVR
jgi:hypothetical protein